MKDITRIENAIVPFLIFNSLHDIDKHKVVDSKLYANAIKISREATNQYLACGDKKKELSRHKRLERLASKISVYFCNNNFDTRKALLVLTKWAFALNEQEALEFYSADYIKLLQELQETFEIGFNEIENFEKIDASAAKQVLKVHAIAQNEGYF